MASGRKRSREEIENDSLDEQNKENDEPLAKRKRLNNNNNWNCSICTFSNKYDALKCAMCEVPPNDNNNNNNNGNLNFFCLCNKNIGYDLSCSHKLCLECTKKYILDGINDKKWSKEPLKCPKNCNNSILPSWLIKKCNLSDSESSLLEKQQNLYNLMIAKLCIICRERAGEELQCEHNLCKNCCKKYILNGIISNKWKKQSLCCPESNCLNGQQLPNYMISSCGISQNMINKIESMQNEYIQTTDPTITSCPKCNEPYYTEKGDINNELTNKNEKGVNGQILSLNHKNHKTKYRFRCSKGGCKTIFCSGCKSIPYHIGFTCDEYKKYVQSKKCRFCEVQLNDGNIAKKDDKLGDGLDNVCNSKECLSKREICCDLKHVECGHNCIGLRGYECFKCLNPKCLPKNADITEEDFCNICWVDPLKYAPSIRLECGHYFHFQCLKNKISKKWPSPRITFGFLNCPLCKKEIHHPALHEFLNEFYIFKAKIQKDAIERIKIEGLDNDKRLSDKNSGYYNNLNKYAMDRLAFYLCAKCGNPYFGGMKACEEAGREQEEKYQQDHLICGSCASGVDKKVCKMHGTNYISYKCKFCCKIAIWFCWGTTHFCDPCHMKAGTVNKAALHTLPKCNGKKECPLGIDHPKNGTQEFCLGCVVCLRK